MNSLCETFEFEMSVICVGNQLFVDPVVVSR